VSQHNLTDLSTHAIHALHARTTTQYSYSDDGRLLVLDVPLRLAGGVFHQTQGKRPHTRGSPERMDLREQVAVWLQLLFCRLGIHPSPSQYIHRVNRPVGNMDQQE
jgi:hypothetical protein